MKKVRIKSTHPDAKVPFYASVGAACFDLYSVEGANVLPAKSAIIDTGLCFEIPEDHVMLVFSRSGHGFNHDIRLSNCVAVIDSDYRGTIKIKLKSDSDWMNALYIEKGSRIAQAMIIPRPKVEFELVDGISDDLSKTERGFGGMGSTGVK